MNYTDEQIEQHFNLLPDGVQDKLFSAEIEDKIQKIGASLGFSEEQTTKLNALVNYYILELLDQRVLVGEFVNKFSIENEKAMELWKVIDREIFATIEAIKISALESELPENEEYSEEPSALTPKPQPRMPDVAPDNLPTEESAESILPNYAPKIAEPAKLEQSSAHPFEEKMKKVFTASHQSLVDLTLEPSTPQVPQNSSPRQASDPYREPIE